MTNNYTYDITVHDYQSELTMWLIDNYTYSTYYMYTHDEQPNFTSDVLFVYFQGNGIRLKIFFKTKELHSDVIKLWGVENSRWSVLKNKYIFPQYNYNFSFNRIGNCAIYGNKIDYNVIIWSKEYCASSYGDQYDGGWHLFYNKYVRLLSFKTQYQYDSFVTLFRLTHGST